MSRFFAAFCLVVVSLLALPGALPPFAAHAGSTQAAPTNGARVGSGMAGRPAVLSRKPPARTPRPIRGDGYRVVFKDKFEKLRRRVWCSHQWWEPNPQPRTQYVRGGVLHLVRRRSEGYANVTVSSEPCGQENPKSFKYGYMEARMRYDTVRGNGPAFWLLPRRFQQYANSAAWNPNVPPPFCQRNGLPVAECYGSELDIFEGYGNIQYGGSRTDDWLSGTMHRNTSGFFGVPNQIRSVSVGTGAEMEDYHVYSARWTRRRVCWFFDGAQIGCRVPFDSISQPMYLLLYNWNTVWEDENMPNASTPDRLNVSVDWVRVWQKR